MELLVLSGFVILVSSLSITWFGGFFFSFVIVLSIFGKSRALSFLSVFASAVWVAIFVPPLFGRISPLIAPFATREMSNLAARKFDEYISAIPGCEGICASLLAWSLYLLRDFYYFAVARWALVLGAAAGSFLAVLYSPSYRDGAEFDGSREWRWLRERRMWRTIQDLFDLAVEFDGFDPSSIPKDRGAIFAGHPHGLFHFSGTLAVVFHGGRFGEVSEGRPRRPFACVTKHVFWIPVVRELALWGGCVDAGKDTVNKLLDEGELLVLAPGGVQEMIVQREHELRLYTQHRGCFRVACEQQVPIVPVFQRGENRVFLTFSRWPEVQKFFARKVGYPFPAVYVGPFREPLTMFVGKAVFPPDKGRRESSEVSADDQSAIANEFYEELARLVETHETHPISSELSDHFAACKTKASKRK